MTPKFRAWDKEEKIWLEIKCLGLWGDNELWYLETEDDKHYFEDDLGVKWELLQSTGLKDKNGVEIYEANIISCEIETIEKFIICEQCGCFGIRDKIDGFISLDSINETLSIHKEFEVIGNIYEHPHLLKE